MADRKFSFGPLDGLETGTGEMFTMKLQNSYTEVESLKTRLKSTDLSPELKRKLSLRVAELEGKIIPRQRRFLDC